MPIFQLTGDLVFPTVEMADPGGILAVGGDLSTERLLLAYQSGIFPWYDEESPILWWSPDPRFVIFPEEFRVSRRMRRFLRTSGYRVTLDTRFREVMASCAAPRKSARGTWITPDMLEAYCRLHDEGYAHSVEVWRGHELAGGLYGVSIGKCFFGESMFNRADNASKTALAVLTDLMKQNGFHFIDSQVKTEHLAGMGAREIPRAEYLLLLKKSVSGGTIRGNWGDLDCFRTGVEKATA